MKVIVRCANNRVTKADMEREIERLFQENKDLRVQVGHLHDELANAKASAEIQRGFREEMAEEIEALEKELAKSESESSQGMNAMVKFWEEAVTEKNKAEERAEEYRIALMESDCRVDECEKRMDWLSKEVLEWKATAEGYKNQYEELKAQKEADDKKSEEICTACNERYEDVLAERNYLREEVERLTYERDTAVKGNSELIDENIELRDNLDAVINIKNEYAEIIDEMRKKIIQMQSPEFTNHLAKLILECFPSTGK